MWFPFFFKKKRRNKKERKKKKEKKPHRKWNWESRIGVKFFKLKCSPCLTQFPQGSYHTSYILSLRSNSLLMVRENMNLICSCSAWMHTSNPNVIKIPFFVFLTAFTCMLGRLNIQIIQPWDLVWRLDMFVTRIGWSFSVAEGGMSRIKSVINFFQLTAGGKYLAGKRMKSEPVGTVRTKSVFRACHVEG